MSQVEKEITTCMVSLVHMLGLTSMTAKNPQQKTPRYLPALCGFLLCGTMVGCQLPRQTPVQTASHPQRMQFGWSGFGNTDRSGAGDISQAGADEAKPVHRTRNNNPDTPRDSQWSKWLDYLPKAPRIPLPRTDVDGSEIAVLDPVDTPSQDGLP